MNDEEREHSGGKDLDHGDVVLVLSLTASDLQPDPHLSEPWFPHPQHKEERESYTFKFL